MGKKNKDTFTPKRKRQFKHVLLSELKAGKSPETAKKIAGATVNKTRKEKGELKKNGDKNKQK